MCEKILKGCINTIGQWGCQTWYAEDLLVQNFKIHSIVVSHWYFGFECVQFFQVQSWIVFFYFLFFCRQSEHHFIAFLEKGKLSLWVSHKWNKWKKVITRDCVLSSKFVRFQGFEILTDKSEKARSQNQLKPFIATVPLLPPETWKDKVVISVTPAVERLLLRWWQRVAFLGGSFKRENAERTAAPLRGKQPALTRDFHSNNELL